MNATSSDPTPSGNGLVLISALLLVAITGTMIYLLVIGRVEKKLPIPDDTVAGREILIQRFSGPEYVHLGPDTEAMPHPYLPVADVRSQLAAIVKLRDLTPPETVRLDAIVDELTEQSPSRLSGEDRVNVVRLNLALDQLKPTPSMR